MGGVLPAWGPAPHSPAVTAPMGAPPPPSLTLSSTLGVRLCAVPPAPVSPFSVSLLKAFYDLSLCFPLVRTGRKGRRRVFSLSEADSHGGHWV